MERKCIFCNGSLRGQEKSKEHIFPEWLQEHLGLKAQRLFHALVIEGEIDSDSARPLTFKSHVSGLVCRSCNTGWMSELERRAQPLITPLVDGVSVENIGREDCQTIALWLFKTVLTLHSVSQQERSIPAEHYATVYETKTIPRDVVVAIARHEGGDKDDLFWIQRRGWRGQPKGLSSNILKAYFDKTYQITVRIGHLAWRVHYWPEENRPPFQTVEYLTGIVRWIHPVGPNGISSPRRISDIRILDESLIIMSKPEFADM